MLVRAAAHGVPENVGHEVERWCRVAGRAVLAQGLVVAFGSAEEARAAAADPRVARWLGPPAGAPAFLVAEGSRGSLAAALRAKGFALAAEALWLRGREADPPPVEVIAAQMEKRLRDAAREQPRLRMDERLHERPPSLP